MGGFVYKINPKNSAIIIFLLSCLLSPLTTEIQGNNQLAKGDNLKITELIIYFEHFL